jgi:hypothetical protein
MGGPFDSSPTFVGDASTNVAAVIRNKTQDGSQQMASVENINIAGNKATGATISVGIELIRVFDGSYIRNCTVNNTSGKGVVLSGGATGTLGMGPMWVLGCSFWNSGAENLHITGSGVQASVYSCSINRPGSGNASILIDRTGSSAQRGIVLQNILVEMDDATSDAVDINGCSNVRIDHLTQTGDVASVIHIQGSSAGSYGTLHSSGHFFTSILSGKDPIIQDDVAGVTVNATNVGWVLPVYISPVAVGTGASGSNVQQIVGLQTARKGVAIASAATIAPQDGNFFEITGTTNITTITADAAYSGKMVTLQFTNASPPDIIHGNNIVLAGAANFSPAQNDAITLVCDGTNWIESGR